MEEEKYYHIINFGEKDTDGYGVTSQLKTVNGRYFEIMNKLAVSASKGEGGDRTSRLHAGQLVSLMRYVLKKGAHTFPKSFPIKCPSLAETLGFNAFVVIEVDVMPSSSDTPAFIQFFKSGIWKPTADECIHTLPEDKAPFELEAEKEECGCH